MTTLTRKSFLQLGSALGAVALMGENSPLLAGRTTLASGWRDYGKSGKAREAIPTACWSCVTRDSMIGYVEDGKLKKLEGNPANLRSAGKICSKGQAGVNQVYDPDRILYPLKRAGKRGEGKWKRIGWDEALDTLAGKLKKLQADGHPEKFMFHYGRMKGSDSSVMKAFMAAYGTKTVGGHTAICEGGKWTAHELVWGGHYDVWDAAKTNYMLNFGSNFYETHTSHIPMATRAAKAQARGAKLVTFDVRLSNTAAKSDEWVPVKPGTDTAVLLAMANVILSENLYQEQFIEQFTNVDIPRLKEHFKEYTPAWAEKISTVPAATIERIAREYATTKPSVLITYRGVVAHYGGPEGERAAFTLEALVGNINAPGGRNKAVGNKWEDGLPKTTTKAQGLKILDGKKGEYAYPTHHVDHQVLKMIKDGSAGRPDIYMIYGYNPVYVNGECAENIGILTDEKLIPYFVSVDPFMGESTSYADMILPDATYLERWCLEGMPSFDMVPEWYIRQPVVKPLGEVREFPTVLFQLAKKMGGEVARCLPYASHEEMVQYACENTPEIKAAGGFEYMKKFGTYHDPSEKPRYFTHAKEVKADKLAKAILDKKTGVYWEGKEGEDYTSTKDAYKKYVGQKIGDKVYEGFKPDKLNKSGLFEISSELLKEKGFNPLPTYYPIPEHEKMGPDDLVLTTYKVNVQTHSRTQNCKWLSELYHDNPALINPKTAAARGIKDGDAIKLKSPIGEMETKAKVTEGIHPGCIAVSYHCGHWAYGRYASGKPVNPDVKDEVPTWSTHGAHPNWIIATVGDPITGQMRWMDTVVTVKKA